MIEDKMTRINNLAEILRPKLIKVRQLKKEHDDFKDSIEMEVKALLFLMDEIGIKNIPKHNMSKALQFGNPYIKVISK